MNIQLFTSCTILFLFIPIQVKADEALIFDRFNNSLFNLPKDIPQDAKTGAWALACPAQSNAEKEFVDRYSFTSNALFVKKLHNRGGKASDVKGNICENSFKLSLAFHIRSSTFQFGFEIYYKLSDIEYFHKNTFEDYKSLEETVANLKNVYKKGTFVAGEYKRILKNAFDENSQTELWFNEDRKIGFLWIKWIKFSFDSPNRILKTIAYDISTNSRWPVLGEKCEKFNLGDELYRGFEVDKLYSQTGKMFDEFKLAFNPCQSNTECFKKILLIPIDQFLFGSSNLLCSNLATIPVWASTATERLLKKVDQFLYALYKEIGEPLHVLAGVAGEYQFSKKKNWKKSTLYLDLQKNKIPIQKIVYKIVEYRARNCQIEEKLCWYSAIIVIHNDPFFKSSDRVCSNTITSEWGLEAITANEDKKVSDTIYVCARNRNVMKKLFGLVKGYFDQTKVPGLTLSKFPFSTDEREDIRARVKTMLEKLMKDGDDFRQEKREIIERPAEIDNPADEGLVSNDENGTKPEEGDGVEKNIEPADKRGTSVTPSAEEKD